MNRKLSWMLLALLAFWVSCQDNPLVAQPTGDEVVVGSVEELGTVRAKKITWKKDGSEMVLIPAGTFEMGDHFGEWEANERPVHKVTLDGFYMDADEVMVGQFKVFLADSGYNWGGSWNNVGKYSPGDEYPMVSVDWSDATAYAKWAGKRLPTEAEWEYAARGGLIGKRYPWGNEIDQTKAHYDSWNGGNGTTASRGAPAPETRGRPGGRAANRTREAARARRRVLHDLQRSLNLQTLKNSQTILQQISQFCLIFIGFLIFHIFVMILG